MHKVLCQTAQKKDLCKRTSLRGSGAQRQPTTCTRRTGTRRGGPAIFWLLACKIRVLRRHGAAAMWSAVGLTPSRASVFQCLYRLLACKIRVLRRHGAAAMWSAVGLTPSRASVFQCLYRPLACKIRVLRTSKRGSELNGSRPSCAEARHGFCRQKKKRVDCVRSNQLSVKKFPAPCYSPIVKFTVPSPLEALTTVFGKGTCVTPPPWAPENIPKKKSKSVRKNLE